MGGISPYVVNSAFNPYSPYGYDSYSYYPKSSISPYATPYQYSTPYGKSYSVPTTYPYGFGSIYNPGGISAVPYANSIMSPRGYAPYGGLPDTSWLNDNLRV